MDPEAVTVNDKIVTLDSLLLAEEPHGTFHDGQLRQLRADYLDAHYVLEFDLCVGDPDDVEKAARERLRPGHLRFTGVLFWVSEVPEPLPVVPEGAAWLTSFGPLGGAPTENGKRLALLVPPNAHAWYFYFSIPSYFTYVAAADQSFEWATERSR
jgi:hypothetical protein